ncbi:MAG: VCBS repeat-containing protein, partial [Bacteroidota bacterium]
MPPAATGLDFVNEIQEDAGFNVLEYEYFYNGGGVAVGDVNRDGRPDLFFTANIGPDRLYLNRGNWQFEDVTEQAGFTHAPSWTTGVTMVDINADGWLDIYVCKSGRVSEERRRNALYINNQDGTFSEQAAAYGIDSPAYSTHATFFDYDRDGDLDLYLLNHPIRRLERFDVELVKQQRDPLSGDKLFRNDGGTFVDVSEAAGIIGNPLGFGLSVTTSDIDGDGWLDLYIANDYVEDDYLYINNQDGTFREEIRSWMRYTSNASMGADIADVNNDGLQDVVTLDMLAEDPRRLHRLKGPDDDARFQQLRREGYHAQYTRNMLQLNQGNGTFSEIGQLAGIAQTDWSWAPLLADFDNDGHKDLFVTNGYMRDYTDMDFLTTKLRAALQVARNQGQPLDALTLVQQMSMSTLPNYGYRNRGDLTFADVTDDWGLGKPGLSSGAAYADLDDDGDLDLIVTNLNEPAWLYQNTADQRGQHNYLKVDLTGAPGNTLGIGAHVSIKLADGSVLVQEQMPVRGYQSSVDPVLLFGLGDAANVSITVTWPDGRHETRDAVAANQTLAFDWSNASDTAQPPATEPTPRFVLLPDGLGLDAVHRENDFDDLEREPLLPRRFSRQGPALAVADVNRDGLDDVFVGGAQDQAAQLYLQQLDATFKPAAVPAFATDASFEDVDALFFDADADGDMDLYIVSGGTARTDGAAYQDRLYLNSGFGGFTRAPDALPELRTSGAVVAGHDWDGDGDTDLFVGGHVQPGRYPLPERSYLLENVGGTFADATERVAPDLMAPGLVGDALWADLDGDSSAELVVAGEWMPIRVFQPTDGGSFAEVTSAFGFDGTTGWWRSLLAHDLDGDGDLDLLAGNRGLNTQMPAPATLHAADFDANGQMESVMSYVWHGVA